MKLRYFIAGMLAVAAAIAAVCTALALTGRMTVDVGKDDEEDEEF